MTKVLYKKERVTGNQLEHSKKRRYPKYKIEFDEIYLFHSNNTSFYHFTQIEVVAYLSTHLSFLYIGIKTVGSRNVCHFQYVL